MTDAQDTKTGAFIVIGEDIFVAIWAILNGPPDEVVAPELASIWDKEWKSKLTSLMPTPDKFPARGPHDEGHPHLVGGQFQSDKYPTTPRGKVPLSVKDRTAMDLLWTYADRHRSVDPEFSADLEDALINAGYQPVEFAGLRLSHDDSEIEEIAWRLQQILHSNIPEAEAPKGWSDFSEGQRLRLFEAVRFMRGVVNFEQHNKLVEAFLDICAREMVGADRVLAIPNLTAEAKISAEGWRSAAAGMAIAARKLMTTKDESL